MGPALHLKRAQGGRSAARGSTCPYGVSRGGSCGAAEASRRAGRPDSASSRIAAAKSSERPSAFPASQAAALE